ncbi:hypothetical protein D3C77_726030 [compost metagenome]
MLDLQAYQKTAGNGRRVNIGKGLFRLVEQDQQQWDTQARASQRQQQGIDLSRWSKRQGVGHAQAHHPYVADEIAQRRAGKHPAGTLAEA